MPLSVSVCSVLTGNVLPSGTGGCFDCHPERRAQPGAEGSAEPSGRFLLSLRSVEMTINNHQTAGRNDSQAISQDDNQTAGQDDKWGGRLPEGWRSRRLLRLSSRAEGTARSRGICGASWQISPLPPVGRNDNQQPLAQTRNGVMALLSNS